MPKKDVTSSATSDRSPNTSSVEPNPQSLYFLPEDLEVDEIGDRIPLAPAEEERLTRELAESILVAGQEQPAKVYQTPEGEYRLYIGRRRRNAYMLINAELGKNEPPRKLWCVLDPKPGDTFQAAVMENVHRRNYSMIEFANIVAKTKAEKGWNDSGWPEKQGAEYFKVSSSVLREAMRLRDLPEDIKSKLHRGEITSKGAFALLREVKESKRAEVAEEAERLAAEEHKADVQKKLARKGTNLTKARKEKLQKSKPKTTQHHVRKAARKVEGAAAKPVAPSKTDIIEFFESCDGPAYGYENGAVRTFVSKFVAWARRGEGSERALDRLFSVMVEKADKGSKPTTAKAAATAPKKKLKAKAA